MLPDMLSPMQKAEAGISNLEKAKDRVKWKVERLVLDELWKTYGSLGLNASGLALSND
jgi:hypothetical protein